MIWAYQETGEIFEVRLWGVDISENLKKHFWIILKDEYDNKYKIHGKNMNYFLTNYDFIGFI